MERIAICDSCLRCDEWMEASRNPRKLFRCGGRDVDAVNSTGCTGACLYWCINEISLFPNDYFEVWSIPETDLECMERICVDINEVGYAMLTSTKCMASVAHGMNLHGGLDLHVLE